MEKLLIGGVAGIVSRTCTAPIELWKMRAQNPYMNEGTMMGMIRNEGITSLWKGNGLNCIRIFPQSAINVAMFKTLQEWVSHQEIPAIYRPLTNGGCGVIAGATAISIVYPFETLRSRFALQTSSNPKYTSLRHALSQTSLGELYQGLGTSLMGFAPYNGLCFMFYYLHKEHVMTASLFDNIPESYKHLLCGGFAGVGAVSITYPTDLVRRRLQLQGFSTDVPDTPRIRDVLRHIWTTEGVTGFYRGLGACYAKIFPSLAIQFAVMEQLSSILLKK
mgnify:CR=1 FL=1